MSKHESTEISINELTNSTSKSKRKNSELLVQQLSKRTDLKLNKECQFYIVLTKANIELIWCEEYPGQDAYTHPMYEHIQNRTNWMIENKFVAVYSWRQSKENNAVTYNTTSNKVGQASYPRRYYIRIVDPNESTPQSRNDILQSCANVSN